MENQSIEEMLRDADVAAEPGVMSKVIAKGDDENPTPMTLKGLTSAGWVYIYDTVTHERSVCNKNMVRGAIQKKRPDGSRIFTTVKPSEEPKRGSLKCMLHEDNPNRPHYDDLGLPTCRKSNLTSPFQVRRHMEKRHPQEWATLEQERIERKEQDDRDFQRAMMSGLKPPEAPLYVSKKDREKLEK